MADRYNTPSKGTTDWHIPLNENFSALERDVEIRDAEANLGNYTPRSGAKFFSTDTGRQYVGDGQNWLSAFVTPPSVSADPSPSTEGVLWFNSQDRALRMNTSNGPVELVTDEEVRNDGLGLLGLPTHYIGYASDLSNEEISRFTLDAGDVLEVWALELQVKGGGSDSNVSLSIYDESAGAEVASIQAGSRNAADTSPIGTSTAGATVTVRLSTGSSAIDVCPSGSTSIVPR